MNKKNENTGRDFLFRANKRDYFEPRLPLIAIPPLKHWTFGKDSGCDIRPGDTAWITVFPDEACLTLIAPLRVDSVLDKEAADAKCGEGFEFHIPAERLTDSSYVKCLESGLRNGTIVDILAAETSGGMRLSMAYDPLELDFHMFAADEPEEWEFPKFLDISVWAASNGISRQGQWGWKHLAPAAAAQLREEWQAAAAGFHSIPGGVDLLRVKVKPAFTIVRG